MGVAGGGDVSDAAVDEKDSGNGTSNTNNPIDSTDEHVARLNTFSGGTILTDIETEGDTDGG